MTADTPDLKAIYQRITLQAPVEGQWQHIQVGSQSAGESMRISLLIEDSIVTECLFNVHGGPLAIALCAQYSASLRGQTLADIKVFDVQAIIEAFSVSQEGLHSVLLLESLVQSVQHHVA